MHDLEPQVRDSEKGLPKILQTHKLPSRRTQGGGEASRGA